MSNFDKNVDRRTDGRMDGRTDGRKSGRLYRTFLQAGATKMKVLFMFVVSKKKTKQEQISNIVSFVMS